MHIVINNTYIRLYDVKDTPRFFSFPPPPTNINLISEKSYTSILSILIKNLHHTRTTPLIFHLYSKPFEIQSSQRTSTSTLQRSTGFQVACLTSDTSSIHAHYISIHAYVSSHIYSIAISRRFSGGRDRKRMT